MFTQAHAEKKWINDEAAPVVLLSGGVGITPTLSMLASVQAGARPVVWLHAAENSLDHPYAAVFDFYSASGAHFY